MKPNTVLFGSNLPEEKLGLQIRGSACWSSEAYPSQPGSRELHGQKAISLSLALG